MSELRVITLRGELDIARRDEVRFALRIEGDERAVLLDFADVTYADSTILSILLVFTREMGMRRTPVAILLGTPQFARIIQYAGLGDALPVFSERSGALTYLSEGLR